MDFGLNEARAAADYYLKANIKSLLNASLELTSRIVHFESQLCGRYFTA